MHTENATAYRQQMGGLLKASGLPYKDLPADVSNFLVILEDDEVIGCAGVEQYGQYGLLRSVAVAPGFRNRGLAGGLLHAAEQLAAAKGIDELYLLTETAPEYFSGKGFTKTERTEVPDEVKQSGEF